MFDILKTERLRLEPLGSRHAPELLDYERRNREHLRRWEPARDESFYTLDSIRRDIARCEMMAAEAKGFRFATFEAHGTSIVAMVNLWEVRRGVIQSAVLGYAVDVDHQGRGYATEAAAAAIRFAFQELRLHRIETSYQPENTASGKVLRKLGFVVEGYSRDRLLIDGAWRDGILVALVNPNWTP